MQLSKLNNFTFANVPKRVNQHCALNIQRKYRSASYSFNFTDLYLVSNNLMCFWPWFHIAFFTLHLLSIFYLDFYFIFLFWSYQITSNSFLFTLFQSLSIFVSIFDFIFDLIAITFWISSIFIFIFILDPFETFDGCWHWCLSR